MSNQSKFSGPAVSRGLHHITAICGDAQRNVDFYVKLLGMRLVKKTVNFDDPSAYHLYYGDALGRPGTALTFFPYEAARDGLPGSGQAVSIALAVPPQSLGWWQERLAAHGVASQRYHRLSGAEELLAFDDPDGIAVELVATDGWMDATEWAADVLAHGWDSPVPAEYAVRGLHSATLAEADFAATAAFLRNVMGWSEQVRDGERVRFALGNAASGAVIDVLDRPQSAPSRTARGSVHHLAFRTPDDPSQLAWLNWLMARGAHVSNVRDRNYFHSIYFHEPGGVLFEIATDEPGMAIDEPTVELGRTLRLPPQYESLRERIEAALPPLAL